MKHFGAFEAKTHFSEILGNVINGEKFVITKHGVEVAMIIPFPQKREEVDPLKGAIRTTAIGVIAAAAAFGIARAFQGI